MVGGRLYAEKGPIRNFLRELSTTAPASAYLPSSVWGVTQEICDRAGGVTVDNMFQLQVGIRLVSAQLLSMSQVLHQTWCVAWVLCGSRSRTVQSTCVCQRQLVLEDRGGFS
jgi:hypothetical protein